MEDRDPAALLPRRLARIEILPLPGGAAEAVLGRTRRVRLTPDALWLLEQLDGRTGLAELAARLAARFGREVSADDAAELLRRTLVGHGLATLEAVPAERAEAAPALRFARRWTLLRAATVRALATGLAPLAALPVAAPLLALALAALALALARVLAAGGEPWRSPGAWALAVPLAAVSLLVHELGHAAALERAGGVPGAISLVLSRGGLRGSTDLAGMDGLEPRARAGIDLAGPAAQVTFAGAIAAASLARGGTPPAPAIALPVLLALLDLVPVAGTDGRWLLDDLAARDPGGSIVRRVSPGRWLTCLALRLAARVRALAGRGEMRELLHLMPVFVSASFPRWSPARLRRHALRHVEMLAVARRDHEALARGAHVDEVRHLRPLRALRRDGRGVVVCAMHVGPFQYVPEVLVDLGWPVLTYAAGNQQRQYAAFWLAGARRRGASLEVLSPASVRDAARAIRAVRAGGALFVLMDGQRSSARDQHRADFTFLGNAVYMRTGPALLAARAGAPIVLAATTYRGVARRVVEFSDPFPPPEDSDSAAIARTAELYAWFEPFVARAPEQWDGWTWPLAHWRATGASPTATAAELAEARRRARSALEGEPRGARLSAERTRVHWACWNGEHLIVDGPARRVLVADALACRVLDAALRHERVVRLPGRVAAAPEAVADEVARLMLAGLATIE